LDRVVGHIDLDYFYAQVEEVQDSSIKSRPVIVCVFSGRSEDSGVVSTANYKARELGVHSGMPISIAKKKLLGSDPVVIPMDHKKYEIVSERIMQDVADNVDIIESTGIDEAFFDLTSSTGGDYSQGRKLAESIKQSIMRKENLTCSIGLGRSKVVAKLGSDMAKPGGLIVVLPESTESFLRDLPVAKLYGVGPKTASSLKELGIDTIGELARADPQNLESKFGRKLSGYLVASSKGEDDDPVKAGSEPTQFSRVITLKKDTRDAREAFSQLADAVTSLQDKLSSTNKSFRTITAVGILTDLSAHTKSKTFEAPVNNAMIIGENARTLFEDLSRSVDKDFRRVGIRISGLADNIDQKSLSEFLQPAR
jgi:DNA polymerase IV (DinB-like DNA polymerase)